MKDPRYNAGLGIERGRTGEVQRDLAVYGRLSLQNPEQHFGEPLQRIGTAVR